MAVQSSAPDLSVLYLGTDTGLARETNSAIGRPQEDIPYDVVDGSATVPPEYDAVVLEDGVRIPETDGGTVVILLTEDPESVPTEEVTDYVVKHRSYTETLSNRLENYLLGTDADGSPNDAYERITDGVFALDEDWRFTYLNPRAKEITKESSDGAIGKKVWDEFPETLNPTLRDKFHRAMEKQETVSFETYSESLDTRFDIEAYPSKDGLSVYFRDTTEPGHPERAIEAAIDVSPGFGFVLDSEGRYQSVSVNPERESLSRLEPDRLEGKLIGDVVPDKEAENVHSAARDSIEKDESQTTTYEIESPEGKRTLETRLSPVPVTFDGKDSVVGVTRDVTDTERTNRELESYERIAETAPEVFWMFEPEFTETIFVNSAYEELFNRPVEELETEPTAFLEATHPDDRETLREKMAEVSGGEPVDFEVRANPDEGYGRSVRVCGEPVHIDGEMVAVAGFARDTTDRKKREQEIEETRERYETIVEQSRDGVAVVKDENWEYVDGRLLEILNETEDSMLGKPFYDWIHPEDTELVRRRYRQRIEGAEPTNRYDIKMVTSDGSKLDIEVNVTDINYDTETATLATFRDVTRRRERERELEEYETLIESLDDAVYVLDEKGRFDYINEAFTELVGYDEEKILGSHVSLIKDEQAVSKAERNLSYVLSEGRPESVKFEVEIQTADGETVMCEDRLVSLPHEGDNFRGSAGSLRDITERKNRELELEKYESFVETSSDLICVLDEDGRVRYQSPVPSEDMEFEPRDISGETPSDFIHPDDVDRVESEFERVLRNPKEVVTTEYRAKNAEGNWRWCESRAQNHLGDESIRGILVSVRDIHDRKQKQRELKEQTQRLSVALEGANAGVWEWKPETDDIYLHESTERLFGVDPGTFGGRYEDFAEYIPDDDIEDVEEKINEAVSETEPFEVNHRIRTSNGEYRWMKVRAEYVDLPNRSPRYIGVISDVTELKDREQELRIKTRAIEKADTSFCLTDPSEDGNPIVYANDAFTDLTGYEQDEILGRNCRFLQGEDTSQHQAAEIRRAVEEEKTTTVEILNYRKDGTPFWNRIRVSPIYDEDGNLVHYFGSQRDTTELKQNREQLEETNRRLSVLYETVNRMISASSSVRVRELTQEAIEEIGHEPEYYVWKDEDGELESVSSGLTTSKGPVWAAYASSEPFLAEDILAYPVSDDGVIYVSAEGKPDEDLEDFIKSLSASAEAALERFERRTEVLELAERLDERKESLDNLTEIDTSLREMARRIPEQTDRGSLEALACDSLIKVDSWDFAMVASRSSEGYEVLASSDSRFAEILASGFESSPNPVKESIINNEPRFIENVAREPDSEWRKATLKEGYLSVATLPVSHSGKTYGAFQIYSKKTGAFPDIYQTALEDAVTMLGYAISSTERKKASTDAGTVRLTVSVSGGTGIIPRIAKETGATLTVDSHLPSERGYNVYVSTDGNGDLSEAVGSAYTTSEMTSKEGVGIRTHASGVFEPIEDKGGALRACWHDPDSSRTMFEIDIPSTEDSRELVDELSEMYEKTKVVSHRTDPKETRTRDGDPLSALTEKQLETLETAYYEGFFDWPRESTGEELANELGVSPPTLHQHLRSAEEKLVSHVFES